MECDQLAIDELHQEKLRQASRLADEVPKGKKDLRPEALIHGFGTGARVNLRSNDTYLEHTDLVLTYGAWGLEPY